MPLSLEFAKLVEQVHTMGRYLGHVQMSSSNRLETALRLLNAATDLDVIHERIRLVRESSVSGYRGATPAPRPYSEVIAGVGAPPTPPPAATIIAADGSQVYPDQHESALYYLINIGIFVYFHGAPRLPYQFTHPDLFYADGALKDKDGRTVTNQAVNARRSLVEMQWLAREVWERQTEARPLLALHDGPLLKFFGAAEVPDAGQIEADYMGALQQLYDAGALLIGYGDRPRSTYIISLLHLLRLHPGEINDAVLRNNGDLEGLTDAMLLAYVLEPGERSAIMTQNSPQNKAYKDRKGPDFEIAFFYVNAADSTRAVIVRVDLPMWVARDPAAVDAVHALVLTQCGIQGRKRYPYALTRADEMAYVSSVEKSHLDEMIRVEMLRNQLEPELSNKLQSKDLARSGRTKHRLR
ncbi:MAG: DNA double-strand break repair nuclease NurA [Anaerolineae bacterium]|nr:DNA double-strand break repair nuclease NurA [Anaerolineae bacterium]NUQ06095.1 DNA double-strand break repair nuclease NurA [Anaerolineae bacterium]